MFKPSFPCFRLTFNGRLVGRDVNSWIKRLQCKDVVVHFLLREQAPTSLGGQVRLLDDAEGLRLLHHLAVGLGLQGWWEADLVCKVIQQVLSCARVSNLSADLLFPICFFELHLRLTCPCVDFVKHVMSAVR